MADCHHEIELPLLAVCPLKITTFPILPKSLAAYHPNGRRKINPADDGDKHNPGQTKREHAMYDKLNETQNFPVADGFVSFTRTFRYLGLLISYNLRNDDNITSRLAAANASMGRLKEV